MKIRYQKKLTISLIGLIFSAVFAQLAVICQTGFSAWLWAVSVLFGIFSFSSLREWFEIEY